MPEATDSGLDKRYRIFRNTGPSWSGDSAFARSATSSATPIRPRRLLPGISRNFRGGKSSTYPGKTIPYHYRRERPRLILRAMRRGGEIRIAHGQHVALGEAHEIRPRRHGPHRCVAIK